MVVQPEMRPSLSPDELAGSRGQSPRSPKAMPDAQYHGRRPSGPGQDQGASPLVAESQPSGRDLAAGAAAAVGHELVEFRFVLGGAQLVEIFLEFLLFLFQAA